jgi:hypothetical protein
MTPGTGSARVDILPARSRGVEFVGYDPRHGVCSSGQTPRTESIAPPSSKNRPDSGLHDKDRFRRCSTFAEHRTVRSNLA